MTSASPLKPEPAPRPARFATVEAGGTKFNVGIGSSDGIIQCQAQFPTGSPEETLGEVTSWLDREVEKNGPVDAIGLATFGPIDTDPASRNWGRLGPTPKVLWQGFDLVAPFRSYGVPFALDTDVNCAALAEGRWGAGRGCARVCYLTVGTGIGGGALIDGKMLSGPSHPEMGHMFIRRHPDDGFAGICAAHGDCLEGLASGEAIKARWALSLSRLDPRDPANEMIAYYLAQACVNIVAALAPAKIVLGGGVMGTAGLVAKVRDQFELLGNGYFSALAAENIMLAELYPISGLIGGLAIAETAFLQSLDRAQNRSSI